MRLPLRVAAPAILLLLASPLPAFACSCVRERIEHAAHRSAATVTAWTEAGSDALPAVSDHAAALFKGKMWVTGGMDAVGRPATGVFSSSDGRSWKREGELPIGVSSHAAVEFGGKLWVLGGMGRNHTLSAAVYASEDGKTWTAATAMPAALDSHAAVVFKDRLWVIGGHDGADDRATRAVYSTEDGVTWSTHAAAVPVALINHSAAVFRGRLWVVGGGEPEHGTQPSARVFSSVDGIKWTEAGTLPVELSCHAAVVHRGRIWVMGGMTPPPGATVQEHARHGHRHGHEENWEYRHAVYSTADGKTWTEESALELPLHAVKNAALAYRGKAWVLGGAFSRTVLSSSLIRPR